MIGLKRSADTVESEAGLFLAAWVEGVAQAVADEVDAEDGQQD